MKKIALIFASVFVLVANSNVALGAWATANCKPTNHSDTKNLRDAEGLYLGNGYYMVCDKDMGDDNECAYNAVVVKGGTAYKCTDQTGYIDTWTSFTPNSCSDKDYDEYDKNLFVECAGLLVRKSFVDTSYQSKYGICIFRTYGLNSAAMCVPDNSEHLACIQAANKGDPARWNTGAKRCECANRDNTVYIWNGKSGRCDKQSTPPTKSQDQIDCEKASDATWKNGQCVCNDSKKEWKNKQCVAKNSGGGSTGGGSGGGATGPWANKCKKCNTHGDKAAICTACCAKPATETVWNPETKDCMCTNGGTFKQNESGMWSCVVGQQTVPPTTENPCTRERLDKLNEWKNKCQDNPEILEAIIAMQGACKMPNPSVAAIDAMYAEIQSMNPDNCTVAVPPQGDMEMTLRIRRQTSSRKIGLAYDKVSNMYNTFKTSVWKNKDGNFNTARLASDAIAGVVLGTAGGLITSNIIKKNQIKGGFEDLMCTIGGQTVAGWGDEFSVGLQ